MDKEISNSMIYQDERIIKLIQLLQRARDREVLNDETARKLDEIEERVRNGQPVPEAEIELFFVAATDSNEFNERFDILRDEYHAYYAEQKSIQDERISQGEERSDLSRMEDELSRQMEVAVQSGDTKEMEAIQKRMEILQQRKDELQKPQDIERQPQISEEERDLVYEQLEQYEENLQKEVDDNTASNVSKFRY